MNWFKDIFGFDESDLDLSIFKEGRVESKGGTYKTGTLDVPSVSELRERIRLTPKKGRNKITEQLANVVSLHRDENNEGALFQVASQFNLLEMISHDTTPEEGITRYIHDRTQGPACAMACAAGTLYRNYKTRINTLRDIENLLMPQKYWTVKNGYAMFEETQLDKLNERIEDLREEIIDRLRVGIQWETEVTPSENKHLVSQIYCSAIPVSYNRAPNRKFEPFARIILEGTYEAAILAAILNRRDRVFLTLVGAGAFGNDRRWAIDAARKALEKYSHYGLDVRFVTYGAQPAKDIQKLIRELDEETSS